MSNPDLDFWETHPARRWPTFLAASAALAAFLTAVAIIAIEFVQLVVAP